MDQTSLVRESFRGKAYQPLDLSAAIEAVANVTTTNSSSQSMLTGDGYVAGGNEGGISPNLVNSTIKIMLDRFRADPRFAGIDGTGFSTVIIDSGIDLNHPHFGPDSDGNGIADRIIYQQSFIGAATADDLNGHGTHVSATVASSDSVYEGMAPAAGIIALQTNNASGSGPFSAIEQALRWTIANATTYNIASVNMSLGDSGNYTESVSLYGIGDELAALAAMDVVVVASSGNDYGIFQSPGVGYPSADPNSMSIGSRQTSGSQASSFSQRHPELTSIFAPGDPIVAAAIGGGVRSLNGTSMASPHVSGVAVLMQQLATRELGRRLRPTEFETLVRAAGEDLMLIPSTGASYMSMDVLSLGESVWAMKNSTIDIRGAAFNVNDVMVRGQSGTATITLGNAGTTASGPVRVNIYLSANSNMSTTGDLPLGSITVTNVPAGGTSASVNFNFTLPVPNDSFWRSSTTYTIGVVIDEENLIGESDENNNFGRGAGLDLETITVTNPPSDLRGVSFAVRPTATERGQPITVDYTIENIGLGPTNQFSVAFYISQDGTIDPAIDLLLGTTLVAPILAGQTSGSKTFGLMLPSNASPIWSTFTNFTIGMVVDSLSTETESNETNNFARGLGLDSAGMIITPPSSLVRGTVFHDENNNSVYNGPFSTRVSVERAIQGDSLRPGVTTTLTFADLPPNIASATMRVRGVGDFDEVTEYTNLVIDGLITKRVFDKVPLTPIGFFTNVDEIITLEGPAWQLAMLDRSLTVVVSFNNPGSFSTGSANYLRVTLEYDTQSHDQYHVASVVENRVLDNRPTNVSLTASRPSVGEATLTLMALGDVGGIEETATINLEGLVQFTVFDLLQGGADNAEDIQSVVIPKSTLDILMADGIVNANVDFNAAVNNLFPGNFFQLRLDYRIQSEPGVAGAVLSIDYNDDGSVDGTVTSIADDPSTSLNESGRYEFTSVASGASRVRLSIGPDAVATTPANGQTLVNLIVGETRESVNFGFFDQTVPDLVALMPADNAISVPLAAPLVLQFDEAVFPGVGMIMIRRLADQSVFEALDIRGTKVVFNGNTVTATPTLAFAAGTQYYVEIVAEAIVDIVGKSWTGISGSSTWNFTATTNHAPTALAISAESIAEMVPAGSTVGTVTTTDPDLDNTFTYSLVAGIGNTDNSAFTISGNLLKINVIPDFETKSSYNIRIRTTDQGGLFFERAFTIDITNINEPVALTRTNASVSGNVQSTLANTGTWSDPEGNNASVVFTASLGAVIKNANGTWAWSYSPPNVVSNQVVTITANDGTNLSSVTFTINAVAVTPTLTITSGNRTYDRTAYVATATLTGSATPTPTIVFAYFSDAAGTNAIAAPTNAGSYFVRASVAANSNNNAAQSVITPFTILRATLVVSVTVNNKPFDNTTVAAIATRSLSGVIGSDVVTLSGGVATFADIGVGNNKTVNVTGLVLGGANAGNYAANTTVTALANITATVFNRRVFYNSSGYENSAGANTPTGVNAALDTSKVLIRSGATTQVTGFDNVSNYSRGINGVVLDIAGLTVSSLSASDFIFRVAPAGTRGSVLANPSSWPSIPSAAIPNIPTPTINVTPGTATVPGRVRLEWPDNVIQNTWLQIIVKANPSNTGLSSAQTFYLGHAMADVNGATGADAAYRVLSNDLTAVQQGISANVVSVNDVRDVNKDRRILSSDYNFVQPRVSANILLRNIQIPAEGSINEGSAGSGGGNGGGGGAGGNGDGTGGGNDELSLDGFAMMAPPIDLGSNFDNLVSLKPTEKAASMGSNSLLVGAISLNMAKSQNQSEPKSTIDQGSQNSESNTASSNGLDVRLSDDFFASFKESGIL